MRRITIVFLKIRHNGLHARMIARIVIEYRKKRTSSDSSCSRLMSIRIEIFGCDFPVEVLDRDTTDGGMEASIWLTSSTRPATRFRALSVASNELT